LQASVVLPARDCVLKAEHDAFDPGDDLRAEQIPRLARNLGGKRWPGFQKGEASGATQQGADQGQEDDSPGPEVVGAFAQV
jgi:hypothetical protein